MIVRCIAKFGKDLPQDCLVPKSGFDIKHEYRLIINKCYTVYDMTIFSGYLWYYISDETGTSWPHWNPSPLFEVVEGRLSKYWVYSFDKGIDQRSTIVRLAYPEWANNPYYLDALTDGDDEEVAIYELYKEKMDLEFPNPSVMEKAEILDSKWLMCPPCIDAWESVSTDGMVRCPKCNHLLHNPRYVNIHYVMGEPVIKK